ncbi:hypothetical protein P0L94_04980 [Microbacter sp. GSS18]|nr:hypothetical protein P0L94_04980 [Microbacter sp. GSS18]
MNATLRLPRPVLAIFTIMVALLLAVPLTGAAGGNSPNAKMCQQGGWEESSPVESRWAGFDSQPDCTTYGARGGEVVETPDDHGYVRLEMLESGFCMAVFEIDPSFVPLGSTVTVAATIDTDPVVLQFRTTWGEPEFPRYAIGWAPGRTIAILDAFTASTSQWYYVLPGEEPVHFDADFDPTPCGSPL